MLRLGSINCRVITFHVVTPYAFKQKWRVGYLLSRFFSAEVSSSNEKFLGLYKKVQNALSEAEIIQVRSNLVLAYNVGRIIENSRSEGLTLNSMFAFLENRLAETHSGMFKKSTLYGFVGLYKIVHLWIPSNQTPEEFFAGLDIRITKSYLLIMGNKTNIKLVNSPRRFSECVDFVLSTPSITSKNLNARISDSIFASNTQNARNVHLKATYDFRALSFTPSMSKINENQLREQLLSQNQSFLGPDWVFQPEESYPEICSPAGVVYFPDCVFYNQQTKRYLIVELKLKADRSSIFLGLSQLNLYLNRFDKEIISSTHKPTQGLLFCYNEKPNMWLFENSVANENVCMALFSA